MDGGLSRKKCVPCEVGTAPLGKREIDELMRSLSGWSLLRFDDGSENRYFIEKEFAFADFKAALSFVNEVGTLAESEGHHPDMFLHSWNKVRVDLTTHTIKGLSENDFILAAKIDDLPIAA